MIELELPSESTPELEYDSPLQGVLYKLSFKYSTRNQVWHLTLKEITGVDIVSNITLVPNYDLLERYVSTKTPKGLLTLYADGEYESPPKVTFENLSTNFKLIYLTPQEMER